MKPSERFWSALRKDLPDQLPLTIWNNKLPGGDINKQLLDLKVLIINKSTVWKKTHREIDLEINDEKLPNGHTQRTLKYKTPAGELTEIQRLMPGTVWIEKHLFSGPKDYEALEIIISSFNYSADFKHFQKDDQTLPDGKSLARPTAIHSPMHELIYYFMGLENFCTEMAFNKKRLLHLHNILAKDWQKRVELVASSPAQYSVIEGNTDFSIVGSERFQKYYFPFIERACEILHAKGILAGAHLDANNKRLAPYIAKTSLDFIESFTPPPDCEMTITEAREYWPNKAIIIHFPSSAHLYNEEVIIEKAQNILKEIQPGSGIAIGTMEDVPDMGRKTLVPMYRYFREHGKLPLKL